MTTKSDRKVVSEHQEGGVLPVTFANKRAEVMESSKPSLQQKLNEFDPQIHGGEIMISGRLGQELFKG
jgi:hypothetical protein